MSNITKIAKKSLMLFCIVFSFATLVSCVINLAMGFTTDTYIHILDRAALSLIGCLVISIILEIKLKNPVINFILPYVIFMSLAFIYVFISGLFQELHPNAYRDIFLNDTIAYIVVYICISIYGKIRAKLKKK